MTYVMIGKVLLRQLVVISLISKYSAFMETGYLITVLQNARYWTVSWATSVSFPHPQSDFSKTHFTVLPPTHKCQKSGIFSWGFRLQNAYATDFTTCATGEIHFLILRMNIDSISRYRCKEFRFYLVSFFRYGSSRTCRRGRFYILFALFLQQMQPVTRHFPCCVISGLFEVNEICHLLRKSVVSYDLDYTTEVHNNYRKYVAILSISPTETQPKA